MEFIQLTIWDIIDIFLTAFLFYNVYLLIRNTAAIKIFFGLASMYIVWIIVKALDMKLLGGILGHVTGLGALAIIIVFQQEIRKFFLLVSNKYLSHIEEKIKSLVDKQKQQTTKLKIWAIANACVKMSKEKTGALIVIQDGFLPERIIESGAEVDALTTSLMLRTIFKRNSPMHDGAVVIRDDRIVAAKCILPLSHRSDFPPSFGLRHRAAAAAAEQSNSFVVTVSEETGHISWFYKDDFATKLTIAELRQKLETQFEVAEKETQPA